MCPLAETEWHVRSRVAVRLMAEEYNVVFLPGVIG